MNDSWKEAVALYDSLIESGWQHIRPFRELVQALANSGEASGLTALTSHETLIISPYTRYPDWFEGRHVRVHPLKDGTIRIDRVPQRYDRHPTETWTLPLECAPAHLPALLVAARPVSLVSLWPGTLGILVPTRQLSSPKLRSSPVSR
jgi:hypothetical protein